MQVYSLRSTGRTGLTVPLKTQVDWESAIIVHNLWNKFPYYSSLLFSLCNSTISIVDLFDKQSHMISQIWWASPLWVSGISCPWPQFDGTLSRLSSLWCHYICMYICIVMIKQYKLCLLLFLFCWVGFNWASIVNVVVVLLCIMSR